MTIALPESAKESIPGAVRRYLDHAIAPDASPAKRVRLRMHGEIRLKGWTPFKAEETILAGRSLKWNARTKIMGLPVRGFDSVAQGYGQSEWWLLGLVPIAFGRGPDVNRSAVERMAGESIWLPSVLLNPDVRWTSDGPDEATFTIPLFGRTVEVSLGLSPTGSIETISFRRWGKPNGLPFGLYAFGGYVEAESTFGDFTVPSRLRMGWHFGTERFETDGEFFRVEIDAAEFA